jgi:hypothetical protein
MGITLSSVADVLDRAADLIEPEGKWTQGASARDAKGESIHPRGRQTPVCFCGFGAVVYLSKDEHGLVESAFRLLDKQCPGSKTSLRPFPEWQDQPNRTQAEVVAKLRSAALRARGTQQ